MVRQASQMALMVQNPPANAGDIRDTGSTPGSRRSPGGGHGNPLQYSCLENPMDKGDWWATVQRAAKNWTWLKLLSRRRQWHPTPVLFPGKSMGGGAWWAAVHGVAKSWTRLSDFTFTFHFHALEKEVATHSTIRAWRIPGTAKPGGLLSMGSHRVGHDWSGLAVVAPFYR